MSEEELFRAWLFRVDRFHLLDPDGLTDHLYTERLVRLPPSVLEWAGTGLTSASAR